MLRDSDNPEKSWEDLEAELLPHRPFYAPGETEMEKDLYAKRRCAQQKMKAEKRPDVAGRSYYYCTETNNDD
ncbi:hypothetical protein QUA27_09250 [Microcoleus sp. Pol14C6]|uniref:hypothetical protein n=1 Tax=unclassified Microcoleus TaxID=2642155 RepID=UPI002FD65C9A